MFIELTRFGGKKHSVNVWRIQSFRSVDEEYQEDYPDAKTIIYVTSSFILVKEEYEQVKKMIYKTKKEMIEKITRAQLLDFDE